jgi:hypothetical protein
MEIKKNKIWKGKYKIRYEKEKGSNSKYITQWKMQYEEKSTMIGGLEN